MPITKTDLVRDLHDASDLARALAAILRSPERTDVDLARQICADLQVEIERVAREIEAMELGSRERLGRIAPPGASLP